MNDKGRNSTFDMVKIFVYSFFLVLAVALIISDDVAVQITVDLIEIFDNYSFLVIIRFVLK